MNTFYNSFFRNSRFCAIGTFLVLFFIHFAADAQNRRVESFIDYTKSYEGGIFGACWENGTEEYTVNAGVFLPDQGWCDNNNRQCNNNGDCQNNNNACGRTSGVGTDVSSISSRVDGWEDDSAPRSAFNGDDDCRGSGQCNYTITNFAENSWRTDVCRRGQHEVAMRWRWFYAPVNQPSGFSANINCIDNSFLNAISSNQANVTWYWQGTNSNGTSTANPSTSNFAITADGTYYLRARGNRNGAWSSSRALTVTGITSPVGNPAVFGNNEWNVYAYQGRNLNLSGITYKGFYTESNLTYDTRNRWNDTPSQASGYQGCSVGFDNHTVVSKRQGFPCGTYTIDITNHDDETRLYVNGTQVFENLGCCQSHPGVWTGFLDGSSTIEMRHAEGGGGTHHGLRFNLQNTPPTAVCQNVTITLDASGNASIAASQVNNNSTDDCGISGLSVSPNSFNCSNIGANTVTLTVTNINNFSSTCTATVTVQDNNNAPTPNVASLPTVTGECSASVTAPTASDNCGTITATTTDPTSYNAQGTYTVTWTYDDGNGNTSTQTQQVIVDDVTAPVADVASLPDATGECLASVTAPTATDNCEGTITASTTDPTSYNAQGTYTVTWTYDDGNGNTSTQTQQVIVDDVTAPVADVASLPDATGECSASVTAPTATDNCEGTITATTTDPTSYNAQGNYTVTWTYDDGNGNTSTQTQQVIVDDVTAPTINCPSNITQNTDANVCEAVVTYSVTGSDNCSGETITQTAGLVSGAVFPLGTTTNTFEITDIAGNTTTCSFDVTVEDNQAPNAICQDLNIDLDASGAASIRASDVDNGSNDACGIASVTISQTDFDCSHVGNNVITLTATDNNGNTATCTSTVTVNDVTPPTASCQDISVALDANGEYTLTAAQIDNGSADACGIASTVALETQFTCDSIGANEVTLVVTDVNGNTASCVALVSVEDNINPNAECQDVTIQLNASGAASITVGDIDNGSTDECGIEAISLTQFDFGCADVGANTIYLNVLDNNSNTDSCAATVTVQDVTNPTALCQNVTVQLDASGAATITSADVDNGSADACGIQSLVLSETAFDCSDVGAQTVTLTVTDNNSNTNSCTATIDVQDNVAPSAVCQAVTIQLDATGSATLAPAQVDNGSADACGLASLVLSKTAFGCVDVGAETVTLTVTDNNGNATSCNTTVTIQDNVAPTATCQAYTLQLDATGNGTISVADVDGGSADACGTTSISLDNTTFDCSNVGANTVVLTIADNNGNSSSCDATVTVEDNVAPVADCKDLTIQLDATGNASITASTNALANSAADFSSTQGSGGWTYGQYNAFNAAGFTQLGNWTGFVWNNPGFGEPFDFPQIDANGGHPAINSKNWSVRRWTSTFSGDITISGDFYDRDGNCGDGAHVRILQNGTQVYEYLNVPTTSVPFTLNLTVSSGDQIDFAIDPIFNADCDDTHFAASIISAGGVDDGSNDACGIDNLAIDVSSFDCSNVGANTVTLTATDVNGNTSTCTSTVTVQDVVVPEAFCQDVTVQLDAAGNASITPAQIDNNSTDACGIASTTLDNTTFDCSNVGSGNTVTLTVTDNNGNASICTATVTVEDNTAPVAECQNLTVQLDASGNATITTGDIDNGSADACGIASLVLSKTTFACADVGTETVTLTVTDNNTNVSTCTADVTIEDNIAPNALCQDLTIQLDANGAASITVADVNNGSNDACGIASTTIDVSSFDCSNVNGNTVTLTVTDNNNNQSTCTSTVTVQDVTPPVLNCQNLTVQLDASGAASITANDVDNGSTDECGIASLSLNNTSFDCSNVGTNTVTLTATDNNSNSNTCDVTITVEDNVAPVAECQDITVQLDETGSVNISASTTNLANSVTGFSTNQFDNNWAYIQYPAFSPNTFFPLTYTGSVWNNPGMGETLDFPQLDINGGHPALGSLNWAVRRWISDYAGTVTVSGDFFDRDLNCGDGANVRILVNGTQVYEYLNIPGTSTPYSLTLTVGIGDVIDFAIDPKFDAGCDDTHFTANINSSNGIDNGSSDACGIQSLNIDFLSFGCADVGNNTVTLTVVDNNNNQSQCTSTVTVEDNVAPVAVCQNVTVQLDASGNGSITTADIDNGSADACGIQSLVLDETAFDCSNIGANTVTLTVTDNNSNVSTCTATVTVEDNVAPVAVCQDVTIQLNASGNASITTGDIDNGSSDACGIASLALDNTDFTCANVGSNTVTLTATDNNSNTNSCTAVVTVQDNVAPVAVCQNVTIQLDAAGDAAITTADIDNGSSDACGIASLALDNDAFDCSNVGANTVALTVTDNNTNATTCTATVTVEDNVAPVATCQDVTVQLDATGNGSITTADIDNGSSDACGIASLALNNSDFTCANVGGNTVTLTVVDNNGNQSTCTANVDVQDNVAPVATCQDVTVQLNGAGNGSITTADINNGSSDACGIASLALDVTAFDCSDVGTNPVVLTVTDNNGNVASCNATVTVEDNVNPAAVCQDITVQLDASGNVRITPAQVDNGSGDACGNASLVLDITAFDCSNVGANTVTLTVTDNNNNASSCTAEVTVEDNVAPVALCQNVEVQLDATGNGSITTADIDNGSSDACGIASLALDNDAFDCSNVGANTVTLTVTDNNSNTSTCTAIVDVKDEVAPVALCQNVEVQLDATGNGSITTADIDNGSSDACGIASLALDNDAFDCSNVGANTVTLTVTDNNNNVSTCTAAVDVKDEVAPAEACQDITIQLDAAGNASITTADIDNGSSDACGIASLALDNDAFDCSNVGANTVTLTVTDNNNNVSTCTSTVTVEDNVAPVATCQDIELQLDASGNGSITTADIDNGSSDACGIASLSLNNTDFTCVNVGANTVTLTVTDNNNNVSTCTATVDVKDEVAPVAICQDITVELDINGNAAIIPTDINNGSNDACGIASLDLDNAAFDCSTVGGNTVTLTVTDNNGNESTCTATVTVEDNISPQANCRDITVQLDANGMVSIVPEDVDNGSSDNCAGTTSVANALPWINEVNHVENGMSANNQVEIIYDGALDLNAYSVKLYIGDFSGGLTLHNSQTLAQIDAGAVNIGNGLKLAVLPASVMVSMMSNDRALAWGVFNGATPIEIISWQGVDPSTVTTSDGFAVTHDIMFAEGETSVNSNSMAGYTIVAERCGTGTPSASTSWTSTLIKPSNAAANNNSLGAVNGCQTLTSTASSNGLVLTINESDFDCSEVGIETVTLTVTDPSNNSSSCQAQVTVEDNVAPVAVCQDITVQLDASGNATITPAQIDNGSSDACGIASLVLTETTFDCSDVGANGVTLTVTDNNNNVSSCAANVTIEDNVAPVAVCQDITIQLDVAGNAAITTADIDNSSNDACGVASLALDNTSFDCTSVGSNTVELTVTDVNGNVSTCTSTVTVEDNVDPVATCMDVTVQLDASGNGSITVAEINNASADACGNATLTLDETAFDCSNVGANTVTLTVTDNNGNSATCQATVTVEDNVAPVALCQDVTVQLDANGTAGITTADIDNGSSDACGVASLALDVNAFDCSNVGANDVVLTVTDNNGNATTCDAVVTVEDNVAPVAVCAPATIQLDATGNATITTADVDGGSNDACGIQSLAIDVNTFTCIEVGANNVVLTVTDNNNNVSTCTAVVTIEDNVAPNAICQNVTVQLDASGNGSITTADIDAGSSDACGVASLSLDDTDFDCSDLVAAPVTSNNLFISEYVEGSGNNKCIEIFNNTGAAINLGTNNYNVLVYFNGSSSAGSNINLTGTINDGETFVICNSGASSVITSQADILNGSLGFNGDDAIVLRQSTTILDVFGKVGQDPGSFWSNGGLQTRDRTLVRKPSITEGNTDDVSGFPSLSVEWNEFSQNNTDDLGNHTVNGAVAPVQVTLTVTDNNGNSSTCTANINVEDNVAPVAICQDITIQLDASGDASITTADIDNGSNDACGIAELSLDKTDFGCANVGANPVVLTVTDNNDNTSTCNATVTVEDNVAPVAVCEDVTVQLDASGNASITTADVNDGSNDACGIASLVLDNTDFGCANVGNNTVTLTVTDNNSNTDVCTATITVEDNVAPVAICQDITVQLDASGNASITTADVNDGSNDACGIASISIDDNAFDCSDVSQAVVINDLFFSEYIEGSSNNKCVEIYNGTGAAIDLAANDYRVKIYSNGSSSASSNIALSGVIAAGDVFVLCNSSASGAFVDDQSSGSLTFNGDDAVELSKGGTTLDIIGEIGDDPGSFWSVGGNQTRDRTLVRASSVTAGVTANAAGFPTLGTEWIEFPQNTASNLGAHTVSGGASIVTLTITDNNGNASTCTANVTVEDNVAPVAECQDVTVQLDAAGAASITTADIDNGSNDACGIESLSLNNENFTCANVGANPVTLTVTDNNGNVSTCGATVTVEDNVAPVAICQDVTVQLDASGNGSVTAAQIDNASSDACGIASLALDNTAFTCANIGGNTVELTVTDNNGNASTCQATVTVEDNVAPVAECQAVTVQLDASGNGSITTADVDNGSNDACGIASLALDNTDFTCANVGGNTVTLTVTDNNGNASTCQATITVEDNVAPVAECQAVTVQLDASGNGSVTAAQIDNGSNDACGIASLVLDNTSFDCSNVGGNTVELSVTDNNGNASTCQATVTVEDNVAPVALCQNVTVQLDASGNGSVTAAQIDNASSDACGIASLVVDITAFDCSNVGANPVELTVTDNNGNVSTCGATVTVEDNVAPVAECQNITVQLDASGNASITTADIDNGSNDACGVASLALDVTSFACANVGANDVVLTVTDNNGNASTCDAVVTVEDNVAPVATCQAITIQLDANGDASITVDDINDGSSDACGIANLSLSQTAYDCSNVGVNNITLTVTDNNSNQATCTTTVTVEDNVAPVAECQDITAQLDINGVVMITPADIDNGSSDACGIANLSLDITGFDCSNIGTNAVELTVTDNNGNATTCGATVTVEDNVAPTEVCNNITVQLDATGNATIVVADIDGGSTDACGVASTTIDVTSFTCAEVGANDVTLTVTDVNGNVSTCVGVVTIEDNVAPIAICMDASVTLDVDGNASITTADIDNGSNDACGIASLALSQSAFSWGDYPSTTVTLTVTDNNGNESTCDATVEVNIICDNVTDGGEIGDLEIGCGPFDPAEIISVVNPSGGGNAPIEYVWLSTTDPTAPMSTWTMIPGANGVTYDPGTISETTYFRRCARRLGCTEYIGESNLVAKIVNGNGNQCETGEVATEISGNADAIKKNRGVSHASNTLGAIDGQAGLFYHYHDYVILDLGQVIKAGEQYTITWKKRNYYTNAQARMLIYESMNAYGWGAYQYNTSIYTTSKTEWVHTTITAQTNTRYVKLRNYKWYADFEVDAVSYCNVACGDLPPDGYCQSEGMTTAYEWIDRVQLEAINNQSGDDGGYANYTDLSTDLEKGEYYDITLTPGFSGNSAREYWKVWIDWNQDGDFNDAHETVYWGNGHGVKQGTICVPSNAAGGETVMRVSMKNQNHCYPSSCEFFWDGEVEDYTINVVANYCESYGNNTRYEYINHVAIGDINNLSGNDLGYGNYTAQSTNVSQGSSYTVNLAPGFTGWAYKEYWTVYVDWNGDKDFDDAGEKVGHAAGYGAESVTFNVPNGATLGSTRMRVQMSYNGYLPHACCIFNYGEVEDYTLNIVDGTARVTTGTTADAEVGKENGLSYDIKVYPNPTIDYVNLDIPKLTDDRTEVAIVDVNGSVLYHFDFGNVDRLAETIDVREWSAGTYFITISNGERRKTESFVKVK